MSVRTAGKKAKEKVASRPVHPREIKAHLDSVVIGQEEAKRKLTKTRKTIKAARKIQTPHKPKVLSDAERQTRNRQAEHALYDALSGILTGWRTIGNAWTVIRSKLEMWKSMAVEDHYHENFDEFLDASGWDEEDILEYWQDEDGNVSDEDRDQAIANAIADFVGDMDPEAMDELLNELAEHDNRELTAA